MKISSLVTDTLFPEIPQQIRKCSNQKNRKLLDLWKKSQKLAHNHTCKVYGDEEERMERLN
jgi:hypothetical protein